MHGKTKINNVVQLVINNDIFSILQGVTGRPEK